MPRDLRWRAAFGATAGRRPGPPATRSALRLRQRDHVATVERPAGGPLHRDQVVAANHCNPHVEHFELQRAAAHVPRRGRLPEATGGRRRHPLGYPVRASRAPGSTRHRATAAPSALRHRPRAHPRVRSAAARRPRLASSGAGRTSTDATSALARGRSGGCHLAGQPVQPIASSSRSAGVRARMSAMCARSHSGSARRALSQRSSPMTASSPSSVAVEGDTWSRSMRLIAAWLVAARRARRAWLRPCARRRARRSSPGVWAAGSIPTMISDLVLG